MKLPALIRSIVPSFAGRSKAVAVAVHETTTDDEPDYRELTHAQRLIFSRLYGDNLEVNALFKDGQELTAEEVQAMENALRLKKAPIEDYALFLYNYMMQGGRPTHPYNYPYERVEILLADKDVLLPIAHGAASLDVVVRPGVTLTRMPGFDHGKTYHMDGLTTSSVIPVYPDVAELVMDIARQNKQTRLEDTLTSYAAPRLPKPGA